ncbi:hypothetical protein [Actinoplanes utahensis]|uniref:hypothetical protein n=1 Tax=Actinoplanes utahensis TaxID=1869 RepID=UPI001F43F8E7|nr:hypothetical protein [Actinoplanes utahensis]
MTFGVGGLGDLGEHGTQQRPVEIGKPVVAEPGDEDELDVAGVVQPGRRPDPGAGVEPVPQPPFDGPAITATLGGAVGQIVLSRRPGRDLGDEPTAADPLGAAEQVRCRALEVPGTVAALGQSGAVLLQSFALLVAASASFEGLVVAGHDCPPPSRSLYRA